MKFFILLPILFLIGCSSLQKNKPVVPPSVSTAEVVKSLEDTKIELKEAGTSNAIVIKKIDTPLTLAEKLEMLLEQIEKEQINNKEVIK